MAKAKNQKLKFVKKQGTVDLSLIDNVLEKSLDQFVKKNYQLHGQELLANEKVRNLIDTLVQNKIQYDPAQMGVPCYTPLGKHLTNEEVQRLKDISNIIKIATNYRFDFYGVVHCVKKTTSEFFEDVDAQHRNSLLYVLIVKGLVKGYDESNWQDFPVPSIVYTTDDPTFPGLLALMLNGEGQTPWGDFEFLRIHSNNVRLHHSTKTEDLLAFQKVQSCKIDGHSVPLPKNHKDKNKKGAQTHIDSIMANDNMERFAFIQSQNLKWWPMEDRSSSMWGFYGHQFDHYKRFRLPLNGTAWEERDNDFHAIIQQVFGNLDGLREAVTPAIKQMVKMTNGAFTKGKSDIGELSLVELIYKNEYNGPHQISGLSGNFTWRDPNTKQEITLVDALKALPNTDYAKKIANLH